MSGHAIAVGATGQGDAAGRVDVFRDGASGWQQAAVLSGAQTARAGHPNFGSLLGGSVALSGATLAAGQYWEVVGFGTMATRVYVFHDGNGGWRQTASLVHLDLAPAEPFGNGGALALVGDSIVLVGAPRVAHLSGRVYVYRRGPHGWRAAGELPAQPGAYYQFGAAVAASGQTVIVGAYAHDDHAGRVYLFTGPGA